MNIVRTYIFVAGLSVSIVIAAGCSAVDEPAPIPEGTRTEFARAVGYSIYSPDGSVDVTLVSHEGARLATGRWEESARTFSWAFDDTPAGSHKFEAFTPTDEGVSALVYTQWNTAYPEPGVVCDADGTCTVRQQLACELNCYWWSDSTYAECWCGCNPDKRSCSYGCCW